MSKDKKVLYTMTTASLAALLIALFLPGENSGRITAAILLLPIAVLSALLIKKRSLLSMNKRQVLMLMSAIGVVYVMLLYLTGLGLGFYKNPYASLKSLYTHVLPISVIIISVEIYRWIIRAQESKIADALSYITCVVADTLIFGNIAYITSFGRFMDFVGMTIFPAFIANLVYHYLSKRYGFYPNVVYRLITTLYIYIIPYESAIPDPLLVFAKLLVPILIFVFIDSLFEKKKRLARKKTSKLAVALTAVAVLIMASVVMLISNKFKYGSLVIATGSMTGELNKADAAIFEQYDDRIVEEGQIIVFEKNGSMIVHRVVDIENIDGQVRYYTKGDANEEVDSGYITSSNIVGIVKFKIPYVGYPTIWLRGLFSR